MKRLLPALLLILIVVALGALLAVMRAHQVMTQSEAARRGGQPLPVAVYHADRGLLTETIPSQCTTRANPALRITSSVSDTRVLEVAVKVGDYVEQGDLLLRLDDTRARLRHASRAQRVQWLEQEVAERDSLRHYYASNRDEGLSLEIEYRRALVDWLTRKGELETERAGLELYVNEIEGARVVAPSSGYVIEISAPGQAVDRRRELAVMAVVEPLRVECLVADDKLPFVRLGQPLKASFHGVPAELFEGSVSAIVPQLDPEQRSFLVVADIPNTERRLLPGLVGTARILNNAESLRIPSVSLINPGFDVGQVFIVDEQGYARLRPVAVGAYAGGYVQVVSGLKAGERVVVAGQAGLRDGDRVRVRGERGAVQPVADAH